MHTLVLCLMDPLRQGNPPEGDDTLFTIMIFTLRVLSDGMRLDRNQYIFAVHIMTGFNVY